MALQLRMIRLSPPPICPVMPRPSETSALTQQLGDDSINCHTNLKQTAVCNYHQGHYHTSTVFFLIEKNYKCLQLINTERKHSMAIQRDEERAGESKRSGEYEQSHHLILANQSTCLTVIILSSQSDCSA